MQSIIRRLDEKINRRNMPAAMARGRLLVVLLIFCGCAGTSGPAGPDVIFLLPGVDGDGLRYASLKDGLRDAGISTRIETVDWGLPRLLFFMNFSNSATHRDAEEKLASRIGSWRNKYPQSRIDLIGHSAGCGVVLGGLARLDDDV